MVKVCMDISESSELIIGCSNGNIKEQKELYDKFYKLIFKTCFIKLKNKMESEDLSHDIFINLLNNIHKFKGHNLTMLSAWIKVFTKNKVIDYIRCKKRKYNIVPLGNNELFDEIDLSFLDSSINIMDDIKNSISNLSPQYRKVFELYYISDYSHNEIAEELNLNVGTSKSNLFKAKKHLSIALSRYNNKLNN